MPDRRETPRAAQPNPPRKRPPPEDWQAGERIAKYLARCGVASRREIEALIEAGHVRVNGEILFTPVFKVTGRETITVNGQPVQKPEPPRLWRYHKPAGLLTTNVDPAGRRTIFEELPKTLPRTLTVGRLDYNTEGLLLLTNDGELARILELPETLLVRRYRARAHGRANQDALDTLALGVTIEGTSYAPISATLERQTGANCWIDVELREGKKREVRRALENVGLDVNRLIRVAYGPFALGTLSPGAVEEVAPTTLVTTLGDILPPQILDQLTATSRFRAGAKPTKVRDKIRRKSSPRPRHSK